MWTSATPTIKQPWTLWTSSPLHMPAKKSNNSLEVSQKSNTPVVFLLLLLFLTLFMFCIPPFHFFILPFLGSFCFPSSSFLLSFPIKFFIFPFLTLSFFTYLLHSQGPNSVPFSSLLTFSFFSLPYVFLPSSFSSSWLFLSSFPSFLLSFFPSFLPSFLSFYVQYI